MPAAKKARTVKKAIKSKAKKTVKKVAKKAKTVKKVVKAKATRVAKKVSKVKKTAKKVAKKAVKVVAPKAKASVAKPKLGKKPYTQSELIQALCADTGLERKQAKAVLESLEDIASAHLNGSPKEFKLAGLCKMVVKKKPATKARKGINPFTGEATVFKAKPASKKVKINPLKKLKEMVA